MIVGWYAHHHGAGHISRLAAALPSLGAAAVTVLSSHPGAGELRCAGVTLPFDLDEEPRAETAGGTLHWAPLDNPGLRERMARISAWIAQASPDVMVVDVSVEVALLARLHGIPTVVITQRGRRTDAPHALAYAQACAVVAPWTRVTHLEDDALPVATTHFVGAISRLDPPADVRPGADVLVLLGAGGHGLDAEAVAAAAAATPERTWHVAGPLAPRGANVVAHGPDADVAALLNRCGVVVGSAGGNVVAEVAAARRAYVCLPQERPFAEQHRQAEALSRLGVAEVRWAWPAAAHWPLVLAAAEARDTARWALLHDGRGAERLAAVVQAVAAARRVPVPG